MSREFYQGIAARALSEFMAAGENKDQAARGIATKLNNAGCDIGEVTATTVINWRERLEQGQGPGASEHAVKQYRMPVPGDTPKERGENLLKAIAHRATLTV